MQLNMKAQGLSLSALPMPALTSSSFVIAAGIVIVFGALIYVTYNIFFYPLRRFPGPWLRAVSSLPHVASALQGKFEFQVLSPHQQYGTVVRVAPNELAFADAEAWYDIYGRHPKNRENPRDHSVHPPFESIPGSMEDTLLFANSKNHARLRRIAGPAFNPRATQKQEESLRLLTDLFISQLSTMAAGGATQELGLWYELLFSDQAGEFVFGESFGCLHSQAAHPIMHTIFNTIEPAVYASALSRYGIWALTNALVPPQLKALQTKLYSAAFAVAERRIEQGIVRGNGDLFNRFLSHKEERTWTHDSLRMNGLFFVIAGSETTTFALTGITWLLCTNPRCLSMLQEEIRANLKPDKVELACVANLPYLTAVLLEGLRLYPPGALNAPRLISQAHGQEVAGSHVPYNTTCAIHQYAAFRYCRNFARPNEFVPDRWLDERSQEFENDRREVMQPFSVGPRNCIAAEFVTLAHIGSRIYLLTVRFSLAMMEMRLALAKLLLNFDVELADPGYNWHSKLKAYCIWKRAPLYVKLTVRI